MPNEATLSHDWLMEDIRRADSRIATWASKREQRNEAEADPQDDAKREPHPAKKS